MLLLTDANSNPKLAVHVRTLYTNIAASPWPIEGGQDIALAGDLVRHLRGLRAQTMRQILSLIKKAVRNLTRVEDLIIKSHYPKITNALLGILAWSPKLAKLDIIEADLKTCQLSRGRGKVPAYEVLKKIVQDSDDPEDVKAEQLKVINRSHTENGWMHCLPAARKVERPTNGFGEILAVSGVEGATFHEDRALSNLPPMHSNEEQKNNSSTTIMTQTQESERECSSGDVQSPGATSPKKNGKEKQSAEELTSTALTISDLRQRFSQESMNRALWNPVEITAYDPRSDQGSSTGSEAESYFQFAKERGHKPPPCKYHDGSYFYPALTHLTLQSCIYGPPLLNPTPGRPPVTPRKSIRATVALRRFLTRCPNLQELTVRDCTIQPEALLDFGSPRRAVWWKSIYGQTLMDASVGPLFMTEMQCIVEVPFEEDLYGSSDGGGQQQILAPPPPPSHSGEEGEGSASESSSDAASSQHVEALRGKSVDDTKRLLEKVWQSLRDNNNRLLTFPNLEVLNIDNCSTFIRPEVPYRWISSPGFRDFFLRHHKLKKLTWDGYILSKCIRSHSFIPATRLKLRNLISCRPPPPPR
jgi:hypothetical protein